MVATTDDFFWDKNITVAKELLIMLIVLKLIYVIASQIYSLVAGNWYKRISSLGLKLIYKCNLPLDAAIEYDCADKNVIKTRKESIKKMNKEFDKYKYKSEIKSGDSKLLPQNGTYSPALFNRLTKSFKIPHKFIGYNGCQIIDENNNMLYDLSSGNAANIIGNKKINEIIRETLKNNVLPASGFSTKATENAINNLLKIYDNYYDCVSFIESGSTAVESCIKQARFYHYEFGNVKRNKIIMFRNAYHGWIINPYLNNEDNDIIILSALDKRSFQYIIDNYLTIASILVDPMKVLSVNEIYPRETLTVTDRSSFNDDKIEKYTRWMKKIEDICKEYGILFVLDECYSGFRVSPYGAAKLYNLKPDYIILSKQIGCGFNTSCIVSKKKHMQRKKDILKLVFSTGTGSTNPNHHAIVNSFVKYTLTDEYKNIHKSKMNMFDKWTKNINNEFINNNLPLILRNYFNCFSLDITVKSIYNWMLCWKLIKNGCVFTPGGTTKFTLSFDYTDKDLNELTKIFIKSGQEMIQEGWFYPSKVNVKGKMIKSLIIFNVLKYWSLFWHTIREDKEIDVGVSHNHPVNRFTHFWSSLFQICISYMLWGSQYKFESMLTFLIFHILRQSGHFFYEAQLKHDEKVKIGYKNGTKKKVALLIPIGIIGAYGLHIKQPEWFEFRHLFILGGLLSVANRFTDISQQHGYLRSFAWFVKIITDPFTDLYDFSDSWNPFNGKMRFGIDWNRIERNRMEYSLDY